MWPWARHLPSLGLCFFICTIKDKSGIQICSHHTSKCYAPIFRFQEQLTKKCEIEGECIMVKETESASNSKCRLDTKGCVRDVCPFCWQNLWSQSFAHTRTHKHTHRPIYTTHTHKYLHTCTHMHIHIHIMAERLYCL